MLKFHQFLHRAHHSSKPFSLHHSTIFLGNPSSFLLWVVSTQKLYRALLIVQMKVRLIKPFQYCLLYPSSSNLHCQLLACFYHYHKLPFHPISDVVYQHFGMCLPRGNASFDNFTNLLSSILEICKYHSILLYAMLSPIGIKLHTLLVSLLLNLSCPTLLIIIFLRTHILPLQVVVFILPALISEVYVMVVL